MDKMIEIYGFEGYFITSDGRVWSAPKFGSGGHSGLFLKPSKDGSGYLKVGLHRDGKTFSKKIHRLVAEHFLENPLNLPEVNHIIPDLTNNSVENLEWCTTAQNRQHTWRLGRGVNPCHVKGELHPCYTYDAECVRKWDEMLLAGRSKNSIAHMFKCSRSTITRRVLEHRQLVPNHVKK